MKKERNPAKFKIFIDMYQLFFYKIYFAEIPIKFSITQSTCDFILRRFQLNVSRKEIKKEKEYQISRDIFLLKINPVHS